MGMPSLRLIFASILFILTLAPASRAAVSPLCKVEVKTTDATLNTPTIEATTKQVLKKISDKSRSKPDLCTSRLLISSHMQGTDYVVSFAYEVPLKNDNLQVNKAMTPIKNTITLTKSVNAETGGTPVYFFLLSLKLTDDLIKILMSGIYD